MKHAVGQLCRQRCATFCLLSADHAVVVAVCQEQIGYRCWSQLCIGFTMTDSKCQQMIEPLSIADTCDT